MLASAGSRATSDEERDRAASEVIRVGSVVAAAVVIQPIPVLDLALITPIQIAMVKAIGGIYGYTLDWKTAFGIIGAFGASIATQNIVVASAKMVPFAGLPVAISVAYAMTHAIGVASKSYFKSGRKLSRARMRQLFAADFEATRTAKLQAASKDPALERELSQLAEAYRAGKLGEQEYMQKKEELLSRL
jgi:uncharacterized protein (DUF697 family)